MRALTGAAMDYPAKLTFVFIVALLLSCIAAWIVAARYRAAMRRLMSAPVAGAVAAVAVNAAAASPLPPAPVTLADNRRDALRLTLLLIGVSCLMAMSAASLWYAISFHDEPFRIKRVAVLALLQLWPMIPALALLWRWSAARTLAALAAWGVFGFVVMLWRQIEPRPLEALLALGIELGSLPLVALLCSGNATRAVAPWLMPPFVGLVFASILGVDGLGMLVRGGGSFILWLVSWLPAVLAIPLFALLPWLLAWWPLRRLGRALGQAYARKQLSELLVLFTAVWAIALLDKALTVSGAVGPIGAALLLPLLWLPLAVTLLNARVRRISGRAPTLLVLRVFQRDAQVQDLFDHVVERWRLSGNTVLIAGTDLADRTLDADDIFTFLDGGLARRFVRTPADVATRLAAFDMARDADGRFRVNECYCHDTTWQDALNALVQRSDVALMDLRSFQAHNAGCRYELSALAQAPRLSRVVVLTDGHTDRAVAQASVQGAPSGRFVWLDTATIDAAKRREVLASLFVAQSPLPAVQGARTAP